MYCKNCNREIADNVRFCTYCGADQTAAPNQPMTSSQPVYNQPVHSQPVHSQPAFLNQITSIADNPSIMLLAFIVTYVFTGFLMTIIANFYGNSVWRVVYGLLAIIQNLSLLIVPLTIKKMPFKIAGFVLLTPLLLYWIFNCIRFYIL